MIALRCCEGSKRFDDMVETLQARRDELLKKGETAPPLPQFLYPEERENTFFVSIPDMCEKTYYQSFTEKCDKFVEHVNGRLDITKAIILLCISSFSILSLTCSLFSFRDLQHHRVLQISSIRKSNICV